MNLHRAKELREQRAGLAKEIEKNLLAMKDEKDAARRAELQAANDRMFVEIDDKKKEIDQIERAADIESEMRGLRGGQLAAAAHLSDDPAERREHQKKAVEAYIRFGYRGMTEDAQAILVPSAAAQAQIREIVATHLRGFVKEGRDLSTTTSGAVLPNEYWDDIEKSMTKFGGMREVSRAIRTATGNPFVMPTLNDNSNKATLVAEAAQSASSTDPTISSLTLNAYTYRSFMLVSREMLQDNAFDINAWVLGVEGLPTRLARGLNTAFTTGTGSSQPKGIASATSSGGTMASGNSVAWADLTELEHSVDPAYRRNARWMFHDSFLKATKNLLDSQNRPIWVAGLALRQPDTILGYPYTVNQDVATFSSGGGKVCYFGDFSKYIIRDVVGDGFPVILRLEERYADYGQVGFFLFSRHDGDLIDAGTDPMKHLVTPSP